MCKMYSKSVYYFNDTTLSWIWNILFFDKTHLYWFSDYLLFLLTVYKYSINSWSVGQHLGNNFNKHKKRFYFWRHYQLAGERGRYQEAKLKNTIKQSEVPHYMFILLKTLKTNLAVDHLQSQLSSICNFFMN